MCFLNLARLVFAFSLHRNLILRVSSVFLVFSFCTSSLFIRHIVFWLHFRTFLSSINYIRRVSVLALCSLVCRVQISRRRVSALTNGRLCVERKFTYAVCRLNKVLLSLVFQAFINWYAVCRL